MNEEYSQIVVSANSFVSFEDKENGTKSILSGKLPHKKSRLS